MALALLDPLEDVVRLQHRRRALQAFDAGIRLRPGIEGAQVGRHAFGPLQGTPHQPTDLRVGIEAEHRRDDVIADRLLGDVPRDPLGDRGGRHGDGVGTEAFGNGTQGGHVSTISQTPTAVNGIRPSAGIVA